MRPLLLAIILSGCSYPEPKCYSPAAETAKQASIANFEHKPDAALIDCTGTVWRVRGKVES